MAISTGISSVSPSSRQSSSPWAWAAVTTRDSGSWVSREVSPHGEQPQADEADQAEQGQHQQTAQHQRGQLVAKTGEEIGEAQRIAFITVTGHRHPAGPQTM